MQRKPEWLDYFLGVMKEGKKEIEGQVNTAEGMERFVGFLETLEQCKQRGNLAAQVSPASPLPWLGLDTDSRFKNAIAVVCKYLIRSERL